MGPIINMPKDMTDEEFQLIREQIRQHFGLGNVSVSLPNTSVEIRYRPVVQFVASDEGDWIACYVNGVEVDQGHSLYVVHLLQTISDQLGIVVPDTIYYSGEQMDALGCHFPERLEDIDAQLKQV